ncbi:hypothetical protein HYW59_03510 [Candidatus Kaiserbacteria bacterium]|nr:hypothetical protein [Candidatus Kaiserbacteria bacterium]
MAAAGVVVGLAGGYVYGNQANKVSVCHVTGSESNPVELISISGNALNAHLAHDDFILPQGATDCSDGDGSPTGGEN